MKAKCEQDIKNKNLFLYLSDDEEIVYVAEMSKFAFYFFFFAGLFLFIIFFFMLFMSILIFITDSHINKSFYFSWYYILFLLIIFIFICYSIYDGVVESFFTDVVLTNKHLIISRLNKVIQIQYSQIKYVHTTTPYSSCSKVIVLVNGKSYKFILLDNFYDFKNKLKEIYPEYNDTEYVKKDERDRNIDIAILALLPLILVIIYIIFHIKL